jgi:hypothetical protein
MRWYRISVETIARKPASPHSFVACGQTNLPRSNHALFWWKNLGALRSFRTQFEKLGFGDGAKSKKGPTAMGRAFPAHR